MSELNRKADASRSDDLDNLIKLTIAGNPPPGKIFEVTFNQIRQEQATEAPETLTGMLIEKNKSGKMANSSRTGKRSLLLVAGLVVGLVGSIAILLIAVRSTNLTTSTSGAVATLTPIRIATSSANLPHAREFAYPGAKTLDFKVEDAPDIPVPPSLSLVFQHTKEDLAKVADYYSKTLSSQGFRLSPSPACQNQLPECNKVREVIAAKGDLNVTVWIAPPSVWNFGEVNGQIFLERIRKQLETDQNLIEVRTFSKSAVDNYNKSMQPSVAPTVVVVQEAPPAQATTNVTPGQKVYFTPDGIFRAGNGLASKTVPPIETETPGMNFQLEWLLSDANETLLLGTLVDTSAQPKNRELRTDGVTVMTLTDEAGRVYELQQTEGQLVTKSRQIPPGARVVGWRLKGKPLASGTRKVTLRATDKLTFDLPKPLEISLQTFEEAKLPVANPYLQPFSYYNGIRMSVPYAYFGGDRTIIQLKLDSTGYTGTMSFASLEPAQHLITPTQMLKTYDQDGKSLGLFDLGAGEWTSMQTQGVAYLYVFEGKPLPANVKSVRFELESVASRQPAVASARAQPAPFSKLEVPVADLLKGSTKAITATLRPSGLPVQIWGVEAEVRYDPSGSKDKVIVVSTIYSTQTDSSADLRASDITWLCQNCDQRNVTSGDMRMEDALSNIANPIEGRSGPTKLTGNYPPFTQLYFFQMRYDPTETTMMLALHVSKYQLNGRWQVTLPVTR